MSGKTIAFIGVLLLVLIGSLWFALKDNSNGSNDPMKFLFDLMKAGKNPGGEQAPADPTTLSGIQNKSWQTVDNIGSTAVVESWLDKHPPDNYPTTVKKKIKDQILEAAKKKVEQDPFGEKINGFIWNNNFDVWFVKFGPDDHGVGSPGTTLYLWSA